MYWNYVVYAVCFLLAVFAVIKEYRRVNKQRLAIRIAGSILAVSALAAIALPVCYTNEVVYSDNEAVLLTEGFNKDSLGKLKNEPLYTTEATIRKQHPKAKFISLTQLSKLNPAIAKLHVLGYGLDKSELQELNNIPIDFHEDNTDGITSASWTEKIKQGQHFTVQGTFNNTSNSLVRLVLKELNTTVDSLTIERQGKTKFEFNSLPKTTGRLVDRLLIIKGDDTIASEPLAMKIDTAKPLKILMLTDAPGFENKFLKGWLASRGFGLTVRSTISKDKISTQFINTEKTPLEHLSSSTLEKFDVLVTDLSILKTLNKSESAALQQQVSENGLGLIIRADTILKGVSFLKDFSIYHSASKDQKPIALQIPGEKFRSTIPASDQLFISNKDGLQPLVSDQQNRLLSGLTISGSGKIVCTTVNNAYSWMLAGNKTDYATFWSLLIGKAAKTIPQTDNWTCITPLPSVNAPVTLQLETAQQPGEISIDSARLSPMQNADLPFIWQASWWPGSSGWHPIHYMGMQPAWIYVYDSEDWASVKTANKIAATKKYASAVASAAVTKQIHFKAKNMAPKIYFYILLLICCTSLWAEAKMKQN